MASSPLASTFYCSTIINKTNPIIPIHAAAAPQRSSPLRHLKLNSHHHQASIICHSRSSRSYPWALAHVIRGEAEGNPSSQGLTMDEEKLQEELEVAIKDEDYERAATIRDYLRRLHDDSKAAVLSANARFYQAFKNGDLAAMHSIWSKGNHVVVVHPGAGRICGYELVMGSWEIVCNADYEFPLKVDVKDVEVHVKGSMGYVTCMEYFKTKGSTWGKQVATNVFERIDGQWFMCIHHASHIDD